MAKARREPLDFAEHPLAAYLPPWEINRIQAAYDQVRAQWSLRNDPGRVDKDAFMVGWVASLQAHHYAGWVDGKQP
jgi:hypothetical protein